MKKCAILLVVMLVVTAVKLAQAQSRLSARAKIELSKRDLPMFRSNRVGVKGNARRTGCFIRVQDPNALKAFTARGVQVNCTFGDYVVAQVPLDLVPEIAEIAGVKSLSISLPMELCNDSARYYTNIDAVHAGSEHLLPCSGKGVVVGVIDTGIDFNHINFKDAAGRTRVKRVYMPQDSTGSSPIIEGDTLPGSHYTTAEQIMLLTTDYSKATHGTHTAGTAAGSYMANGYNGMAPDADLVFCAMPVLYDSDIACAIKYIDNYARSVGKPAVINMSFGSQEGAHDGTSMLCRLFDSYSAAGHIMVISAGNWARERIYLERTFNGTGSDTVRSYLDNYSSSTTYKGYISSWSASERPHYMGITVIDKATHAEVASLPVFALTDTVTSLTLDSIPELSPYLSGEVLYACAVEDNGRFHSVLEPNVKPSLSSRYRMGIKIISDAQETLRAWSSGVIMINDVAVPGYTSAVRNSCISDLATGDSAISVGAYCTKQTIPSVSDGTYTYTRCTPHDIAYFSAYGPDARGISRPDVCAPGAALISSGSRYMSSWSSVLSSYVEAYGEQYPYYGGQGTSMAAPVVTGTIALWLERYPKLTPADVRLVLEHTAVRDEFVTGGNPELWGYGKIDAFAGLKFIDEHFPVMLRGDVNADGIVDVDDVNAVINIILGKNLPGDYGGNADLNGDSLVDVDDVNEIINIILKQ